MANRPLASRMPPSHAAGRTSSPSRTAIGAPSSPAPSAAAPAARYLPGPRTTAGRSGTPASSLAGTGRPGRPYALSSEPEPEPDPVRATRDMRPPRTKRHQVPGGERNVRSGAVGSRTSSQTDSAAAGSPRTESLPAESPMTKAGQASSCIPPTSVATCAVTSSLTSPRQARPKARSSAHPPGTPGTPN